MSLSTPAWSETMDNLVEKNDLFYNKFTEQHPFSGKVTGKSQGRVKDGRKEGLWEYYYDNGQLEHKGNYKDGKKEGLWECYKKNGQLYRTRTYKDGIEISCTGEGC